MKIVTIGARPTYIDFLSQLKEQARHQIAGVFVSEYCREEDSPKLKALGLPICAETVGTPAFLAKVKSLAPDLIVVYGATEILKQELIDIPPRGAINLHAALLPLQ